MEKGGKKIQKSVLILAEFDGLWDSFYDKTFKRTLIWLQIMMVYDLARWQTSLRYVKMFCVYFIFFPWLCRHICIWITIFPRKLFPGNTVQFVPRTPAPTPTPVFVFTSTQTLWLASSLPPYARYHSFNPFLNWSKISHNIILLLTTSCSFMHRPSYLQETVKNLADDIWINNQGFHVLN